jgi:hypothetical protein
VAAVIKFVFCPLLLLLPMLSAAQESKSAAMLRSAGGVWVNGFEVASPAAVFPGDALETKPGFAANLDAEGSSVLIQPESILKFEGNFVELDHGGVSVETSTLFSVHVKCIKVEPTSNERTQYNVGDVTGTVQVAARKNDVKITQSGVGKKPATHDEMHQSSIVHEGEQTSRDESDVCGPPAPPESPDHGINPKWIEIGGGAGVGALILCLLLCKGSPSSPVSPSQP